MIQIAVMGHGTVGSGVLEVFYKNKESIERKAGEALDIKYILDLRDFPGLPYSGKFIKDFNIILNDPEVRVVVEVMGGLKPAYDFTYRCLKAGKSVVTSNKELVAAYGDALLAVAHEQNANFLFEASVGGGIPILRPLNQCLSANRIVEIAGILNGTSNYILTRMFREGATFEESLSEAQKLGYAERDPSADVEGGDACRKVCILASLAYGRHVYPKDIHTEGISHITARDVRCAAAWGGVIKLIGRVKQLEDGRVAAMVSPAFLKRESQLANVDDVFNGIMVRGDAIGDVVFYGRGAGKLPTASAVVADVIDAVKHLKARKYIFWEPAREGYVQNYLDMPVRMFVRAAGNSRTEALRSAVSLFGEMEEIVCPGDETEAAFITSEMTEGEFARVRGAYEALDFTVRSAIRVLDL